MTKATITFTMSKEDMECFTGYAIPERHWKEYVRDDDDGFYDNVRPEIAELVARDFVSVYISQYWKIEHEHDWAA